MDCYSIITIIFSTLVSCLALAGVGLNIYTRKHPFNSFYKERLTICFSTLTFAVLSSIFRSPDQINANAAHNSVGNDTGNVTNLTLKALGNWILSGYYFGAHPTFNWCIILIMYLQTRIRQRKFKLAEINLLPPQATRPQTSPAGQNKKADGQRRVESEASELSTHPQTISFDLQAVYPKPMPFFFVFMIVSGSAVLASFIPIMLHGFHLLAIDSPKLNQSAESSKHSLLYKGLFTNEVRASFQMGSYVYSVLSACARTLIVSLLFGVTACQLRSVENPNKVTRRRGWIKLSLAFVVDALMTLLTLTTLLAFNRLQAFLSLFALLCAASSTLIYVGIIPPCTIVVESKANS